MNSITNMEIRELKRDMAEIIKDNGYEKYFTGSTLDERVKGMEEVIRGCHLLESIWPLFPPSLESYRMHYISSNMDYWDREVMVKLKDKFGSVSGDLKIRRGHRDWIN